MDWAHLGTLECEDQEQKLWAFTFTMGYSRRMMAEVAVDQKIDTLLRMHGNCRAHGRSRKSSCYSGLGHPLPLRTGATDSWTFSCVAMLDSYGGAPRDNCAIAASTRRGNEDSTLSESEVPSSVVPGWMPSKMISCGSCPSKRSALRMSTRARS